MKLLIVESPTKTKSIKKYLGGGYEVMASMGHLRDLPKSKMGIEITKKGKKYSFKPEYMVVKGKGKDVKKLITAAKKVDEVVLATDPDREGEAIAHHVKVLLSEKSSPKFTRIVFHSITKSAIEEALKEPKKIDEKLYDAQQARRVLDRLVGYEVSPILWRKVRRGLSAGRVQSVALRLIVEREEEIEKFKAKEYWQFELTSKAKKGR
jgi:DNA topoisomerase-1